MLAALFASFALAGSPLSQVHVGDTQRHVRAVLGSSYVICEPKTSKLCKEPVWLYEYVAGQPLGIAVRFHNGRVTKVFRLRVVAGWH